MSLTLLLPYKILARFVPDCDHDKLYTQALFRTFIYLLPSRKSYYLLSFCTINHFVRVAVTFSFFFFSKWWTSYLEWNPSLLFTMDRLIIVYFLFLVLLSVRSGAPGPVHRTVRQPGSDVSIRAESACQSASQPSLQSRLCGSKH